MKKSLVLLILAFALFCSPTLEASLYLSSGGKSFTINVVRRDYRPIYEARGNVFVVGNTARIEVSAPGYRSSNRSIYLKDNVNSYYETITLDDPTIFVNIQDSSYASIDNATCNYFSQTLYQSDEFGIRGRLPVAGFEKLTSRDIDIRVNSMFAWLPRVYLNQRGDYWDYEIVLRRRDFSDFSNRIQIIVRKTPADATVPAEVLAFQARDYLNNVELIKTTADEVYFDRLSSLAREITASFNGLDAENQQVLLQVLENAPQLHRELQSLRKFAENHR